MQSLARLLAFGFANGFLEGQLKAMGIDPNNTGYEMSLVIDSVWRFVAGFGGVFAIVAIGLRLTMPESPRYTPGIGSQLQQAMTTDSVRAAAAEATAAAAAAADAGGGQQRPDPTETQTKWLVGARRYLRKPLHRQRLIFVCVIWFLLDVCFYGTGLDSPSTLNLLWLNSSFQPNAAAPDYAEDPANITQSIYWVLHNNGARALEVSSISAMTGSLLMIPLINYFTRRNLLIYTSLILAVLFFVTGALVITEFAQGASRASLVFFALAQFTFNIGPNTIVFVLVAEIFPTVFRGTFYGLAAACGKIGAMIIRPCVQIVTTNIIRDPNTNQSQKAAPLGGMLIVFGVVMLVIAIITRFVSPEILDVQKPRTGSKWFSRLDNKLLETIAPNPRPGELLPKEDMPSGQHNDQQHDNQQNNDQHNGPHNGTQMYDMDHQTGKRVIQTEANGA